MYARGALQFTASLGQAMATSWRRAMATRRQLDWAPFALFPAQVGTWDIVSPYGVA